MLGVAMIPWMLPLAVCLVAMLYASVGHGGASGYLAVMTLLAMPVRQASTSALVLNILVASTAWWAFARAGYFSWRMTWPFLAGSIPAAFVGGALKTSDPLFYAALATVLLAAGVVMWLPRRAALEPVDDRRPPVWLAGGIGAGLGVVSGMVGVGGGIFLSPLMIVNRWASMRRVAATSACFIVINSAAGLLGRGAAGWSLLPGMVPFVLAACAGGLVGSWLGSTRLHHWGLRMCLALVLLMAAWKMFLRVIAY